MNEEPKSYDFASLPLDTVISLIDDNNVLINIGRTFEVNEYLTKITKSFNPPKTVAQRHDEIRSNWCVEGIEAKVLIPGEKWQTGKVRLTMEFCPDLPESPAEADQDEETSAGEDPIIDPENHGSLLDDIRQTLLQQDAE